MEFPFPFDEDAYHYRNNAKPLNPPCSFQVTGEYTEEMADKRQLLATQPRRTFQALPETDDVQWEALGVVCRQLATYYPTSFSLNVSGNVWTFQNRLLDETHEFIFGDSGTLPVQPLNFIGSHVQEDLILMGERDGDLYLDAGQLAFPGNWSVVFNLGMPFLRIHEPVPIVGDSALGHRIRKFLLGLRPGTPWTRLNWSLNAGRRLDTSPETFSEWGPLRHQVTADNAGDLVHLRVEHQTILRLTEHQAILFTIHTYLMSLHDVTLHPGWGERLYRVLASLPQPLSDYKGITQYRAAVLSYLAQQLGLRAADAGGPA
jgi:dimethylamine monooxygenase subunit A